IQQLLNDIIAVENENRGTHFIGSIVYIHEGIYMTSSVQELVVIDGQQRLTTISILYVALYRFAKENGNDDTDRLYNSFLINQYARHDANRLKLKQTDKNATAFKATLNGNEEQIDTFSNIIENYNYFRRIIDEDNFDLILRGLDRLIFVNVSLEIGRA